MNKRYKIWNKTDDIYFPSGIVENAEQTKQRHRWVNIPTVKAIICNAVINGGMFMEFEQTKEFYKKMGAVITDGMTDEQILQAIQDFEDKPQVSEPSAEERIAAAMEFDNIMKY